MPCVTLFVNDPAFLELELVRVDGPNAADDLTHIRAKAGLEFLERDYVRRTDGGWIVRFLAPRQPRYQHGIQPVFIATVPNTQLSQPATPWRLLKVRWKSI
jgi:hypothetical protein